MKKYIVILASSLILFSCNHDELSPLESIAESQSDFFDVANVKVCIAGCLHWEDSYDFPGFSKYHRKDKELEHTLEDLGVKPENIIALYDEDATLQNIKNALDTIAAQSDANTHFIFYYAGHGFPGWPGDKQSIYFANYDVDYYHLPETGFNVNILGDDFRLKFKGSQVLFMADCCQSGSLITEAQKFADEGKKAAAITSCASSNWSTGNWTYTQKIIDALNGDAYINADGDGKITFNELITDLDNSMRITERQKYGAGFFNWDMSETITKTHEKMQPIDNAELYTGEYVFAKIKNNYRPVQVTDDKNGKINCRFYNYADYEDYAIDPQDIKVPYFVQYTVGENVMLENFKEKPVVIVEADNEGFYRVQDAEGLGTIWATYEKLSTLTEPHVSIQNADGDWVGGRILQQTDSNYFVTYDGKNFQWDEWVTADRIQF